MRLYTIIGAMSGTSMDGLDLALCQFFVHGPDNYTFEIQCAETIAYPEEILSQLREAKNLPSEQLLQLDKVLGTHYAKCINNFIASNAIDESNIDAIASHGHTIFHQPEKGFTLQIGCGDTISSKTGIKVINDFRQKDVVNGGQGAPLVPIGDNLLFSGEANGFLNIGGFTNISIPGENTIAFDICPGNLPLNEAAIELGSLYDNNGAFARSGKINLEVLSKLNALPYYDLPAPKSLGTEWLDGTFLPILKKISKPEDRLCTCVEHISEQIGRIVQQHKIKSLFISGGGAFNGYLLERLAATGINIVLPEPSVIEYKEALIFGFLGVRFLEEKVNCLSSVTGASHDVCGGVLHLP